jgi:hypothetical protein
MAFARTRSGLGSSVQRNAGLNILLSNRYMFRAYDHLKVEI